MQLLLFLSALLSGLTGVISGDRVTAPSNLERGSAEIVAVAEDIAEASVRAPLLRAVAPAPRAPWSMSYFAIAAAPAADPLRFNESWLE